MKKFQLNLRVLIRIILLVIVAITIHQFISGHKIEIDSTNASKKYTYLFHKEIYFKNIDKFSSSYVTDKDILNDYLYYAEKDNRYSITIWDFKTLKDLDLNDVRFEKENKLSKAKEFLLYEILNPTSDCPISLKYLYEINDMNLKISGSTKILRNYKTQSYKGFYGLADRISIVNKKGVAQILFNFKKKDTPLIFIIYKDEQSLYLIMILSNKDFDENVFNILNLK